MVENKASVTNLPPAMRTVRSFVRREGRMTIGQRNAFARLWSEYGIDVQDSLLDLDAIFMRQAPRFMEIGFGNGDALLTMARQHPENDYIGIEVHRPGVGSLMRHLDENRINNVRVICDDAVQVLKNMIPNNSLDAVHLFFPDPWHKKRHHKRRIVQPEFVELVADKLKPNGVFHMATDWEDYAVYMMEVMSFNKRFANIAGERQYSPRPDYRPLTKFEKRGQRLGHGVWDLLYKCNSDE